MSRFFAWSYSALLTLAALYAGFVDISMRNDPREHMLPDLLLLFVTSPLSLTLNYLYRLAPAFFNVPFMQLSFMTFCGAVQAGLLWWIARKLRNKNAG